MTPVDRARLRIALVVQRYGEEVNGGAELECRWIAEHLARHADVHVFTTCAEDYARWENTYPTGTHTLNGVHVHRHAVDVRRKPRQFARLTKHVLYQPHTYMDELAWMAAQGPISTSMLAAIESQRDEYDVFVFFTYLYATTYYGIQLVPGKSMLVPTAHDEPTLYLSIFRALFQLPRYLLYQTGAERELVQSTFGNTHVPSAVVGTGVNVPETVCAARFRRKYGIDGDFVLYIGRMDQSKNISELLSYHHRHSLAAKQPAPLVLVGRGDHPIPKQVGVRALGFVSEQDKFDALAACALLIVPSRYESLSIVLLEAWLVGKPVLVNGQCEVLREQCLASNGGLYYNSYDEFAAALDLLLRKPTLRHELGCSGQRFAQARYSWNTVERKYLHSIARVLGIPGYGK